jgi:signal transduction histidine kinase/CheY-like chemotaxis protein
VPLAKLLKGGLIRNLLISHLTIAAVGAMLMGVAFFATYWLETNARQITEKSAPLLEATNKALLGLNQSVAAVCGWAVLGDDFFKEQRNIAWQKKIRPAISYLSSVPEHTSINDVDFSSIVKSLHDLEEWQWAIEDVAQTPGNFPARVYESERIHPVSVEVYSSVTALIELQKEVAEENQNLDLLLAMGDFRDSLSRAENSMLKFIDNGKEIDIQKFRQSIAAAETYYAGFLSDRISFGDDSKEQFAKLDRYFTIYLGLIKKVARLRQAPNWNVSRYWLKVEALPRAQSIELFLSALAEKQIKEMKVVSESVGIINRSIYWLLSVLFAFMLLISYLLARRFARTTGQPIKQLVAMTNEIATGQHDSVLTFTGDDEISHLGQSICQLAATLEYNEQQRISRDYLRKGRELVTEKLRGDLDLQTMANQVVNVLCEYTNATVGTFYEYDEEEQQLQLKATFGIQDAAPTFSLGEGLPGQVAKNRVIFSQFDLPEEYLSVSSSIFKSMPRQHIILPMLHDDVLCGVMELGTLTTFNESAEELLISVSESISIAIKACRSRNVEALLEELNDYNIQMQEQQISLRKVNEELEEQTMLLKDSEEALRASNEELEEKSEVLGRQKSAVEEKNRQVKKQSEELAQASQYKSDFLANMSHELRTPLNSILILSQSLSRNKKQNLTDHQVEDASIINNSGKDLLALINDILDLSKVEAGKMEFASEIVDVSGLMASFEDTFSPIAEDKGIQFLTKNTLSQQLQFKSDRQRLAQIIKNLISNAIKFTSQGNVSLKVDQVEFTGGTGIRFAVIDTGIGIPENKQETIFKAFHQADGSTSREYGGTGLGLSISWQLTECLGGKINIESKEGQGSTFEVLFPATLIDKGESKQLQASTNEVPEQKRSPNQINSADLPIPEKVAFENLIVDQLEEAPMVIADDRKEVAIGGKKSLLIIEDDKGFAQTLLTLAHDDHYLGIVAGEGREGIKLAHCYPVSAIILDLGLPDIDGQEVLNLLKNDLKTRHLPVHVIAGREAPEGLSQQGAIGFLQKPIDLTQMQSVFSRFDHILGTDEKTVLVIEGDLTDQQKMKDLLENDKTHLVFANDLESIEDCLESHSVHCLILDIATDQNAGISLLEKVKQNKPENKLPVIIHTGQELDQAQLDRAKSLSDRVILKDRTSASRLLDETQLFLHHVTSTLPEHQREVIHELYDDGEIFKGKHILLVDDDMRNLYALSGALTAEGMKVTTVENGEKGVAAMDATIDLVLMDIMMPIMNGYEAIEKIRQDARYQQMPIIALTAKAMSDDRQKCIDAGASDYFAKPVDAERLLSLMKIWLQR